MRNEGARMEIMIAALFALVVFQQAQIAHLNTRLITVLENQVAATALERNTAIRRQGAPGPPAHHFYQEHDEIARSAPRAPTRNHFYQEHDKIARNAPRAPTRNLHDRHYTGPCELTLPRPAAGIWLQPGMEPKHDHHQHGAAIIAVILALTIAMFIPSNNEFIRRIFKCQTRTPDSAQSGSQSQKSRQKKKKRQPTSASESEWPQSPADEPPKAELAPATEMQPDPASLQAELRPAPGRELTPTTLQKGPVLSCLVY